MATIQTINDEYAVTVRPKLNSNFTAINNEVIAATVAIAALGDAAALDVGTAAGTVAAGDHTHTIVGGVTVSGSATPTLAVTGTTTVSGTNTGDQTTITGNAGTATKLATARAINGVDFDGSAPITITAAPTAHVHSGDALTPASLAAVGTVTGSNLSGTNTGDQTTITGNAGTATKLATARAINGVNFDGSAAITITAAGSTLSDTVPVGKGGTGLTTGTSGGIPYFSSTSAITSSAALTDNGIVIGGGAGATPETVAGLSSNGISQLQLGVAGTSVGSVQLRNATSGSITLQPTTGALGTITTTFPATTGTVYVSSGTDVAVADGGTGRSTSTTAYGLIAAGTTATGAHQTLPAGPTTDILVGGGASALPAWTTATGSGAPVRATSPTLVTPVLGTPSSGTLTNCTIKETFGFALSDETTALTTGLKLSVIWPHASTITSLYTCVTTAPTGATLIVDVKEAGTTILSTKPAIDASEFDSRNGTAAVISDASIASGALVTFHIDQVGASVAGAGLKIFIEATRS